MTQFEPRPFGNYFLTEKIAVGGMAEIYKAKTFGVDGFEKVLAIKKILSHYSSDREFVTMLTDEAKLVVNLSHANIVQVYDLGRVGNDYFISMEYIDGVNLRQLVDRARELRVKIPVEIITCIASEVCKGLDHAHNRKDARGELLHIVHRDISPQNILVSFDGGVKIVDFGIAKAAMNLSHTNIGVLKGKVNYMSPEQAFGKPMDGLTDVFSLGVVLYELFNGQRLFTGESQMEVLKKIRNTKINEETLGDNVPDFFKPVILKASAYQPKDRYQSAADMQIALTKILYSHFSGFSPRRLSDLMHEWFKSELESRGSEVAAQAQLPEQTVLMSSSKKQVNIVHRDTDAIFHVPTLKPEDEIKKKEFLETPPGGLENTEKSEITAPRMTVDEMLKKKRRQNRWRMIIALVVVLVLLGLFYVL